MTKVCKETRSNHHEARHRWGAREHEGGGEKGTKPEECGDEKRRSLERGDGAEGAGGRVTEGRALGLQLVGNLGWFEGGSAVGEGGGSCFRRIVSMSRLH